jgi:hypothetical protein
MELDRRHFFATLGGAAAVAAMDSEAKADALEDYMIEQLSEQQGGGRGATPAKFPTAAEIEAQINTRHYRRGAGSLFVAATPGTKVDFLEPMPAKPTFLDFFEKRFTTSANHCLQSANRAMKTGMTEEIILACLLHDTVQALMKTDHGYWGAQMYEPYVPAKTSFAIKYHQALRFYADPQAGYEYPDLYRNMFGEDYVPPPHIQADYKMLKNHKWYMEPRLVTVNDLYAFDPNSKVSLDPFREIVAKHFKDPKEGLGNDNSPVAHFWRTIARPDAPL